MKKLPLICGLALVTGLMIHDAYGFIVTDQGLRYYLSEPKRLLYVLGLALVGGVVAWVISRLSPQAQRGLRLLALGIFALALTAFLGLFVYFSLKLPDVMTSGATGWLVSALVMFGSLAIVFWCEFVRVWKTGRTRFL